MPLAAVPESGEPNFDKVNVSLQDPDNPDEKIMVKNVGTEANCDPVDGGWYYDNPDEPHMIKLCPASCLQVQQTDWSVKVEVGCEMIVL